MNNSKPAMLEMNNQDVVKRAFNYILEEEHDPLSYVLSDVGFGNVSKGLIVLDLLSSVKRRKNSMIVKCLNFPKCINPNVFYNPDGMTQREKVRVITTILKINELCDYLEEMDVNRYVLFERLMVYIFDKVSSGEFYRSHYNCLLGYLKRTASHIKRTKRKLA